MGSRPRAGFSHRDLAKLPPLPAEGRKATTSAPGFQRFLWRSDGKQWFIQKRAPRRALEVCDPDPREGEQGPEPFLCARQQARRRRQLYPGRAGSPGHPETGVLSLAFARLSNTQTHKHTNAHQPSRPSAEGQSRQLPEGTAAFCLKNGPIVSVPLPSPPPRHPTSHGPHAGLLRLTAGPLLDHTSPRVTLPAPT